MFRRPMRRCKAKVYRKSRRSPKWQRVLTLGRCRRHAHRRGLCAQHLKRAFSFNW